MKDWITALQSTHRSVGRWAMVGVMAVAILSPLTALTVVRGLRSQLAAHSDPRSHDG